MDSSQAEADSAVNNHVEPPPANIPFYQRYHITSGKVCKAITLIFVAIIFMAVISYREEIPLDMKGKFKYKSSADVRQVSGLDEEPYRAYYYYMEMVKLAKQNTLAGKKFDATATHQFDNVIFNQLLGLFKVVKAIQYAKNYSAFPESKQEINQIGQNVDPQLLQKSYNYSDQFLPAANQYACGSCYSFPITATIQYLYKKHHNISIKLSEQQLIDCSSEDQSKDGCSSGNITKGFEYAQKVGLVTQESYPYRSKNGHSFPCRKDIVQNPNIKKYKIDGFLTLPKDNCLAIQLQLSRGNTIAAMIAAGELFEYTQLQKAPFRNCPKEPFNHAITIVGQTEKQQWIVRNSWGSSWGKNGYFIIRGNNTCGICTHSIVPFLNIST